MLRISHFPGAADVLGLAAYESGWGESNIAINYNNYFGLTAGPNFTGTTGVYHSPNGSSCGIYPAPGFLSSGLSFAESSFGARVRGISGPVAFAEAMVDGGYNSEHLQVPYWEQLTSRTDAVQTLIKACIP